MDGALVANKLDLKDARHLFGQRTREFAGIILLEPVTVLEMQIKKSSQMRMLKRVQHLFLLAAATRASRRKVPSPARSRDPGLSEARSTRKAATRLFCRKKQSNGPGVPA
jgi:hypothetical protein